MGVSVNRTEFVLVDGEEIAVGQDVVTSENFVCSTCGHPGERHDFVIEGNFAASNGPVRGQCAGCFGDYYWEGMGYPREIIEKIRTLLLRIEKDKRGLSCTLTLHYVMALFDKQQGRCFYTGELFTWGTDEDAVSLNRLDPEKGYIKGNVVFTTWRISRTKGPLGLREFRAVCGAVAKACPLVREFSP